MDWPVTESRNSTTASSVAGKPPGGTWQPDWRASLPLALFAALLVLSGLVFLPYRWWSPIPHPERVSILLNQPVPKSGQKVAKPRFKPRPTHAQVSPVTRLPSVTIKPPAPPVKTSPINWEQQIDSAAAAEARIHTSVEFNAPRVNPLDRHLERVLNAPRHIAQMKSGDSYRAADGSTIIKSGDRCGSIKTLQIGLSPTNKATVGTLVPCPGENKPTMGDELKDWADKRARQQPPP